MDGTCPIKKIVFMRSLAEGNTTADVCFML